MEPFDKITDHIKRSITPEDAFKIINKEDKDFRLSIIRINDCLDSMHQTLFYGGIKQKAARISSLAARLSLEAAVLSYNSSKLSIQEE
jgi:hypothetical protein